jgi:uncharacterized protein
MDMDVRKEYIEASIESVSLSNMGFVVFLKELESERVVPIFIGASEAHSISSVINHQKLPRPLTHDLFKSVLDLFESKLLKINITSVVGETFFATITLSLQQQITELDSRPSDAIGLALRCGAPVFIHREVLNHAGIIMAAKDSEEKNADAVPKSQLETYKEAMQKAISEERYEDAAKLRDQILQLQKHQ